MNRQYEIRADGDYNFATLTRGNNYFEIPYSDNEVEIQENIDFALLFNALNHFYKTQCRDDVYCAKQIVRQDYSTGLPEAQSLIQDLQENFPDYDDWLRHRYNVVGRYTAYREPYSNSGVSFYNFGVKPSEALLLRFGTSYLMDNLKEWYGLKFDFETKDVMLKVVFNAYDGDTPELPQNPANFFAQTHYEDGSLSDWVDYYAYATPKRIRQFCEDKGLSYPLPENTHTNCDVVWCWGFVFNKNTLEYGPVKAYARYNIGE